MANKPDFEDSSADKSATDGSDFFAPRRDTSRGFGAYGSNPYEFDAARQYTAEHYTHRNSRTNQPPRTEVIPEPPTETAAKPKQTRWWWPPSWKAARPAAPPTPPPAPPPVAHPQLTPPSVTRTFFTPGTRPNYPGEDHREAGTHNRDNLPSATPPWPPSNLQDENGVVYSPVPEKPSFWEKQPYAAIAHTLALSGTLTFAWFFGILAAQILPGQFENPPLQESTLRKTSRLASRLWHLPQLWHSPMAETRIEAIPIPETGPVLTTIELSPIERQPLIDELNAIETELLTLDRRLQALEKRLGRPPYKGADVDHRLNALRTAIDPPVREILEPRYQPVATHPDDKLLEVAKLKIVLPSDALFTPGQSQLRATELLPRVLDQLVNYPDSTILVRSYSDDQAKAIASRQYTLAQANTLASYLQRSLPTNHRWVTLGGGQSQPVADNTNALNRQQNRRIEILVDTRR